MRLTYISIAVVSLFFGLTIATAGTVTRISVRSGEHPKFSRLVFDIGANFKWSIRQSGNKYIVKFTPPPRALNLSEIFKFIPKIRILSVNKEPTNPGEVILSVARGQVVDAVEIWGGNS